MSSCLSTKSLSTKWQEDASLATLDANAISILADVSSVGFEWKPLNMDNLKGFVIYRAQSGSDKGLEQIDVILNPYATHYYNAGLSAQTKYIYAFATISNDDSISPKSEPLYVQTSFIDAVESLFAITNAPKSIKLIWSPHPNPSVSSYILQRLNTKSGEFKSIKTIPHRLSVEYFDTNLDDDTSYTYRIIAKSFEGIESKPSKSVSATTIAPPKPIENITASENQPRAVVLSWDEAQDSKGVSKKRYEVSYSLDNKHFKKLATTSQTTYTHSLSAESDGIVHYYQVILLGDNGLRGRTSGSVKGSSLAKPSTPKHFSASVKDGKAELSWEAPSDDRIMGYIIYRKEGAIMSQVKPFNGITETSFSDESMQKGKKYHYSVVSVDEYGIESAPTQTITLSLD